MATPDTVLFSPLQCSVDFLVDQLIDDLDGLALKPDRLGRLEIDAEDELAFAGEIGSYHSIKQIKTHLHKYGRIALSCYIDAVRQYMYFYIWHDQDKLCFSIEIPGSLSHHRYDGEEAGKYLLNILIIISTSLSVDLCVYGIRYTGGLFTCVREQEILIALRDGTLLDMGYPNIHIISFRLVEKKEMTDIVQRYIDKKYFQYRQISRRYHVLSFL